ncbi:MAG: dTMP kinase [Candidatus Berkelbacteria bacterium Licking1014_7]|uniref:Thymidylate kinase n=1 Tax=Candidatus Berkelbacteria bacterium Licking1014_7 TaxID=2017147 RepID=A0A554LKH0_9BACT|nr:MAG: dTMP kinase [Candidatus Berkelbacteria bacterium Licking1014_7]
MKFIVIEGIDGSGTTTQSALLAGKIFENYKHLPVLLTREPTGGKYGLKIRKILAESKKPQSHKAELLKLFIRDRQEHLESFENFDGIVISDRHKHSTFAYQQAQGVKFNQIFRAHQKLRPPDLTIILDLPVKIALSRMKAKKQPEVFDRYKSFLELVRRNYLALASQLPKEKIYLIDGSASREQVSNRIWKKVRDLV